MQQIVHYFLHFGFPGIIAFFFFKRSWKVYGLLILTMLVDVDHLLASPIFAACRCSIGFHPLHNYVPIVIYFFMLIHPRTRIVGIGLLLHMATDGIDCIFIKYNCG